MNRMLNRTLERLPRRRLAQRVAMVLILVGALGGCGGGTEPADEQRAQAQGLSNTVVLNDVAGVTTQGQFQQVDGYLSRSRKVLRSVGSATASAAFPISVSQHGYYELYAWWPQAVADAGAASVTVEHAGGKKQLQIDQSTLGGQWNSLGVYEFTPSHGGHVLLWSVGSAPLLVDAIRYQFVSEQRPALTIRSTELPIGMADQDYRASIAVVGGEGRLSYGLSDGALPPGLQIDGQTGVISGMPAYPGSFTFSIVVRDTAGEQATQSITLGVAETEGAQPQPQPYRPRAAMSGREGAQSTAAGTPPDLSNLLNIVAGMPEGGWSKVNLNSFSSAWAPPELRPLFGMGNPTPAAVIKAWSSFAWDPNRGNLLIYGGGHANYRGNEVYLWRGSTQRWERASLPSEMVQDALGNWNAVDSADNAPASAHTYDNTLYFPIADRMVVLGGAADANGGHFLRQDTSTTSRRTGVYLFDPSRADPDKVGGSTGSHVRRVGAYPEILGGNMWVNRESFLHHAVAPKEAFVNGCTSYAKEGGLDVAYIRTASGVYRYSLSNLSDPRSDTWQKVGTYWGGPGDKATCSYDAGRKTFVRTATNTTPFVYWDLSTPGSSNKDVRMIPADPTGEFQLLLSANAISMRDCALEFDPIRKHHVLWCGDGRVWTLTPPPTVSPNGWVISQQPGSSTPVPNGSVGSGLLGKWKYIENLDVFMGLQDPVEGNIWLYKPVGWTNPTGANLPPTSAIAQPQDGATYAIGEPITIEAIASDADGSVSKVEFFNGGMRIGEDGSAPYTMTWSGAPAGTWSLTAVATDDTGATSVSPPVSVTVTPLVLPNQPPSVMLTEPAPGATVQDGAPVSIAAQAADTDGAVVRVEFFNGTNKVGERTAPPYTIIWTNPAVGDHVLTAVATDDRGGRAESAPVSLTVVPRTTGGATVVLQRGSTAAAVADTYLSTYHKTLNFGTSTQVQDLNANYAALARFAIFQSEGGPVPNGARIQSAVLSLYKYTAYNMNYQLHPVLWEWSEMSATWNQRMAGVPWAVAGANGAGTDYAVLPDATASTDFSSGWVEFNLTAGVQRMSDSSPLINHGWRLRGISGYTSGLKRFYTSDFAADPSLRPKLVVTYE